MSKCIVLLCFLFILKFDTLPSQDIFESKGEAEYGSENEFRTSNCGEAEDGPKQVCKVSSRKGNMLSRLKNFVLRKKSTSAPLHDELPSQKLYVKSSIAPLLNEAKCLPGPANTWWMIRKGNKIYVDKTDILDYLINRGEVLYFCARPRRFGKTLFAQMLKSYFSGEKCLFYGLKIYESRNGNIIHSAPNGSWIQYPVIDLDFMGISYDKTSGSTPSEIVDSFKDALQRRLHKIAVKYSVAPSEIVTITDLIAELKNKFDLPVVIIIDEYDNLMNSAVYGDNNRLLAKEIFGVIEDLLEEIKGNLHNIGFVWITGVSTLPPPSLHSSFNNYVDVTHHSELTRVGGFTKNEIKTNFQTNLKSFADARGVKMNKIMEALQLYYDGYVFSLGQPERLYNPISVISALREFKIKNFWTSTGSIEYIIKQISQNHKTLEHFDSFSLSERSFFDRHNILVSDAPLHVFMFQTGYLTIGKYENEQCFLRFANMEVHQSIQHGLDCYICTENQMMKDVAWFTKLRSVLQEENITEAVEIMNRAGFRHYKPPLNSKVTEFELTRRFLAMLISNGILSKETEEFYWGDDPLVGREVKGDIHISTQNLNIKYAIELKCGYQENQQIWKGVEQQLKYIATDEQTRISFLKKLRNPYALNLLTIHFNQSAGGHIDDWVFIPYRDGKVIIEEMKTSREKLYQEINTKIENMSGINPVYITTQKLEKKLT